MSNTKKYTNGEVTIVWEAEKCIHSGICVKGLPDIFKPRERPWIKVKQAPTEALISQVKLCPSGALSFFMNDAKNRASDQIETHVEVRENGPLLVYGTLSITHRDGTMEKKNKTTAFCRCGLSNNKPYCDGTHVKESFNG